MVDDLYIFSGAALIVHASHHVAITRAGRYILRAQAASERAGKKLADPYHYHGHYYRYRYGGHYYNHRRYYHHHYRYW